MATDSQQPKGRDGTISALNMAIETMNLAKEVSSITPAKAVFGSVSILLTMIRVGSVLFYDQIFHVDVIPGLYAQQPRLRRTRASLRGCMSKPRPWGERKAIGRDQSIRARRDWAVKDVGLTGDGYCTQLTHHARDNRTVAGIQERITEKRGRGLLSRLTNAKNDKDMIVAWKLDLIRILQVFDVCSASSV